MIYKTTLVDDTFQVNLNDYTKEDLKNLTIIQIKKLIDEEKINVKKLSSDEVFASYQCRCDQPSQVLLKVPVYIDMVF